MISIVIPTLNEEKEIERTIRQFEALNLPHEVIISDTGSTDITVAIAKKLGTTVLTLSPGEKRGVAHGRNKGGGVAAGNFIVFLDCGTIIPDPNRFFATALAKFENDPTLVAITSRVEVQKQLRTWSDTVILGGMNLYYALLNNVFHFGIAMGKFQMVRADAVKKVGGFNENLFAAEDVDFFTRLSKIGRTSVALDLTVFFSGRRFHQSGPWRTLYRWIKNAVWLWFFKKPADKEWEVVR
jgi:glycosyltransferase involved in cell wall biosynthesis